MAYITALKHAAMRDLVKNNDHIQLSLFDEKTYTEVTLPDHPNVRYILKKNLKRQADETSHRLALIEKAERELAKIAMPQRKCSREKLAVRASKVLEKFHVQKYFRQDIVENPDNKKLPKLLFSRDCDAINSAEDFDGVSVWSTDVSTEMMTTVEVVETYRSLINVEQAFRQMKTVELEIRPVYHTRDDRIKAHVFVCMLAYFLLWNFRQRVTLLVESDPKTYTLDYILNVLKSRTVNQILYNGIEATKINMPTPIQKKILETLSKA
jgi:transposase